MQSEASQLRPDIVDPAYRAIASIAAELFQARKCGITVNIPEGVREQMMAVHGDEAKRVLALLDGRVRL
jgi:hypothetical protein